MLKVFRKSGIAVKILLWVIVAMIGGTMIITMVPGVTNQAYLTDPAGSLAQIGDMYVTPTEATRRVNQQMQQFDAVDNEVFRQLLLERTVQELIDRRALLYEAGQLGLDVAPSEVAAQLQSIPNIYPGGEFIGPEDYSNLIFQTLRITTGEFERQIRSDLLLQKLNLWITGGALATAEEIEQEYRRRNDRVRLDYVVLRPSDFYSRVQATEDDLRAYYDNNKESFLLPERRAVRYVEVNTAFLQDRIEIKDDDLQRLYNERRAAYVEREAVRVRHILFSGILAGEPEEKRKTPEEVLARLKRGEPFAKLVEEYSTDPSAFENQGEIGWVERGQTVPELEQKLFSLKPGAGPELVEVPYGFHIVQVFEYREERTKPLTEVREELTTYLRQQQVQQQAIADAQEIAAAVRNGSSLDEAAQSANWQASELPLLPRGQNWPVMGQAGANAAFRLPVDGDNQPTGAVSDPVATLGGYVVLQLKEISPAHTAEYDEVRVQSLIQFRQQKAAELMNETARQIAAEAQKRSLSAAARQHGFQRETSEFVSRLDIIPGVGPVSEFSSTAFSLAEGDVSPALPAGQNWVVFRVAAKQPPDPQGLELARADLVESLNNEKRGMAWEIFRSTVRRRLEKEGVIQINQAALNTLLRRR